MIFASKPCYFASVASLRHLTTYLVLKSPGPSPNGKHSLRGYEFWNLLVARVRALPIVCCVGKKHLKYDAASPKVIDHDFGSR